MSTRQRASSSQDHPLSNRFSEVLRIGFEAKLNNGNPIGKGFENLDNLNRYSINKQDGTRPETSVDDTTKCAICQNLLSDRSIDGSYALEALYEPITEPETTNDNNRVGGKRRLASAPVYGGCGHVFHRSCIRRWAIFKPGTDQVRSSYKNVSCPLCRTPIHRQTLDGLLPPEFVTYESDGPGGEKRKVRVEKARGDVLHYVGPKGEERLVRKDVRNGLIKIYNGEKDVERKVRVDVPNGDVEFYEGEKGEEHLVRTKFKNGQVQYYTGRRGEERLVMLMATEQVQFFDGEKNNERLVRAVLPSGTVNYYQGDQGEERIVRVEYKSGRVQFYEGGPFQERLVRTEYPDGRIQFYQGDKGEERVVRIEFPDGRVETRP